MQNKYPYEGWRGFEGGTWVREINIRSFIRHNYTPYDGNEEFLEGPTQDTLDLWEQVMELTRQEREAGGVLDMDTKVISTITSHGPGYLDKNREKIVGFQTDKPFKRSLQPYGGIRMAMNTPIQGTSADIIKIAMVKVYNRLKSEGMKSQLVLQVHDELNFSVVPEEKERLQSLVIEEMQAAAQLRVPLIADCGWGANWLEAH